MVRLLEMRYWKQSDMTHILKQFNDRQCYEVCELEQQNTSFCLPVCMSVCLSVCMSVSLSVTNANCLWLKTYFFQTETPQSQNNPNWSAQKNEVVIMDHPGNSGGEHVCQVFSKGFELEQKLCLHVCLSATNLLFPLLY